MQGTDMEVEDLVIEAEFDRLQRYSDDSLAAQVKQNSDHLLRQNRFQGLQGETSSEERFVAVGRALISACC